MLLTRPFGLEVGMAYREVFVTEIKDVLRGWQANHGLRASAGLFNLDRKAVRRYVEAAKSLGLTREAGSAALTDEFIGQVAQKVRPGRPSTPGDMRLLCRKHRPLIEAWLADGVLVPKVRTLLQRHIGVLVPERTLMRFVATEVGRTRKKKTTVRIADGVPGKELQVDFGDLCYVIDPDTGKRRKLQALIFTPNVSRYAFVFPCWDQTVATVIEGMEAAWQFYGGVFGVIVPDNCKCIVITADPLNPVFCPAFRDYAQSRDFIADPARVRKPQDKGRVERHVKYVQGSFMPGETFASMADTRNDAIFWSKVTAGGREHGTTHKQPAMDFAERELPALLPMPTEPWDKPTWLKTQVQHDHTITAGCALYSMPTRYIGKEVRVELRQATVKVWCDRVLVKTHVRVEKGGAQIDPLDLPPGVADLALRDAPSLLRKAETMGSAVAEYTRRLQADPAPWRSVRQVFRLLGMCKTYGAKSVDAACQKALDLDVVDVQRIDRMLAKGLEKLLIDTPRPRLALVTPLRFARSPQEFALDRPAPPKPGEPDVSS